MRASPPTAWTDTLPVDFGRHTPSAVGEARSLAMRTASAVDWAITLGLSVPYLRKIEPHLEDAFLDQYIAYHHFYASERILADPSAFFVEPPRVEVRERPAGWHRWDPPTARRVTLEFESPFQTVHPGFRVEYASLVPNERVQARAWLHEAGPRPVIVFLHGFSAPNYAINTAWFSARDIYAAGMDVVLMNLPLHGGRTPDASRYHGSAMLHPSMWRMTEACAQGIYDLRILVRYLKERGAPAVGVNGYSWGAQHAALLAGLEPALDFAIPIATVVSTADLLESWPLRPAFRRALRDPDGMLRKLRRMMAVLSPLSHPLRIPRHRVLLVASPADRIVPASHTEALWEHWGRPAVHWSRGGHVVYFDRREVGKRIVAFLRDAGVM